MGTLRDAEIGGEDLQRMFVHHVWCQTYSKDWAGHSRPNSWRMVQDVSGRIAGSGVLDRPEDQITCVTCLLVATPERREDQRPEPPYMSNFALLLIPTGTENEYRRIGLAGIDLDWILGGTKRTIYIC
jgi:hypothetical protein